MTPVPGRDVLRFAIWFALITGTGAVFLVAVKKFVLHQVTMITPQVVWISPLTFVILALPSALLLALLSRWLPRLFDVRTVVLLLAAAGAASGLLVWSTEFNDFAVFLLSLGIGVQFGQLARSKPELFGTLVRRTLPALVGLVVLAAAGLNIGVRVREARAVARLDASRAGAPNVLWIILDTVRAGSLGLYGYSRPTSPNLERFARTAITFDRAIAPSSWTLTSHASMFTGRDVHELSTGWAEGLDTTFPTIAEFLRDRGYRTGGIAGNVFYSNSEWGLDRGFLHYEDYVLSLGHALLATYVGERFVRTLERKGLEQRFWFHRINGRRIAPDVSRSLVRWLERDRERPFFAFVNFYDAHDPYVAPRGFIEAIRAAPIRDSLPIRIMSAGRAVAAEADQQKEIREAIDLYDAGIRYLDDQFGLLMSDLERRGLLQNTLVVVTSDHGEEFGEHGRYWHGLTLYMPSIHVPLIVRLPDGRRAGERVGTPVSLRRLAASTLDVLVQGEGAPFPGPSFLSDAWSTADQYAPVLSTVTPDPRTKPAPEQAFRSIVDGTMHYILSDQSGEELYRYITDPLEQLDLAPGDTALLAGYRSLVPPFDSARVPAASASAQKPRSSVQWIAQHTTATRGRRVIPK
jgi:arylsulfatase A-like enzyme